MRLLRGPPANMICRVGLYVTVQTGIALFMWIERTAFKNHEGERVHAAEFEHCRVKQGNEGSKENRNTLSGRPVCHCFSDSHPTREHHLLFWLTVVEPGPHGNDDIEPNHDQTLNL